jgi:cytochrome c551/c552
MNTYRPPSQRSQAEQAELHAAAAADQHSAGVLHDTAACGAQHEPSDNLMAAYRDLAAYRVTTRRAPYILQRARAAGQVDGYGECGELPYTVTWTAADGFVVSTPDPRRTAVHASLQARFGRAVTVTPAMVDAVLTELDAS